MPTIIECIKKRINTLVDFRDITLRILSVLPEEISTSSRKKDYVIHVSSNANTTKYIRPVNEKLFINEIQQFKDEFDQFINLLHTIPNVEQIVLQGKHNLINRVIYTIQQSISAMFDLKENSNSSRKHVGNRFEDLIRSVVQETGLTCKKMIIKIPYGETIKRKKMYYSCETDLIISPYSECKSSSQYIDNKEVVLSIKTSSKDRMGKVFLDKFLISKFMKYEVTHYGIFLNDIQRKGTQDIASTFVSNLFMVYSIFLTKMNHVYYVDIPETAKSDPYSSYISQFSFFITDVLWEILHHHEV
ncbi:MAG TPA: hypothetical protein PLE74_11810 [Candidatus Cloacimonadota bacterium]|nr:hypothetical protein [Candidatus Cloacimonadota bacterium]HPT72950.1 hypothetical protein [Candidatus Cloacimonadota bacterium]